MTATARPNEQRRPPRMTLVLIAPAAITKQTDAVICALTYNHINGRPQPTFGATSHQKKHEDEQIPHSTQNPQGTQSTQNTTQSTKSITGISSAAMILNDILFTDMAIISIDNPDELSPEKGLWEGSAGTKPDSTGYHPMTGTGLVTSKSSSESKVPNPHITIKHQQSKPDKLHLIT